MRTIFRMSLAHSVQIFNKKSHRTRAGETFKIWPKFESFHSLCPMIFLLKFDTLRAKDIRKIVLILYIGGFTPFPSTQLAIMVILLHHMICLSYSYVPYKIMITTNYKMSYFSINFDLKSNF